MKVKTSELEGDALNWMVAKSLGAKGLRLHQDRCLYPEPPYLVIEWEYGWVALADSNFSAGDSYAYEIIDEALISTCPIFVDGEFHCWEAFGHDLKYDDNGEYIEGSDHRMYGPTRLIAGLRCFVSSKLGDEVDVPDQLGKT